MISVDSDASIRRPVRARRDNEHLYLLRESNSNGDDPGPHRSRTENGVGWVEVVRSRQPVMHGKRSAVDTQHYPEDLVAARGMTLGIVFGLGIWMLIGATIRIFV